MRVEVVVPAPVVNVAAPKPRSVRVEYDADGNKTYVPVEDEGQ